MSQVFINSVLTDVGQGADEIISLRRQLVESQAREQQLREALNTTVPYMRSHALCTLNDWRVCDATRLEAQQKEKRAIEYTGMLSLPQDDTALREMIQRAGEVMRERCCEATNKVKVMVAPGKATAANMAHNLAAADCEEEISALPVVTLEDLK